VQPNNAVADFSCAENQQNKACEELPKIIREENLSIADVLTNKVRM
jgi:hypothetical protein